MVVEQSNGILALVDDLQGGAVKGRYMSPQGDVKFFIFVNEQDARQFADFHRVEVTDARYNSEEC